MSAGASLLERLDEAAGAIRTAVPSTPDVAVVLGSGLGDFAEGRPGSVVVPYEDIPHWPRRVD